MKYNYYNLREIIHAKLIDVRVGREEKPTKY